MMSSRRLAIPGSMSKRVTQSLVKIQLVAQPAPMPEILVPGGKYFEEAITFQRPFTSPFVVIGPQLPCSPHPHAKTSPYTVSPNTCSLPTPICDIDGNAGGVSCP